MIFYIDHQFDMPHGLNARGHRSTDPAPTRIAAIERNPATLSAGQLLRVLSALDIQLVLRDTRATKTFYPQVTQRTSFPLGEW